MSQIKAEIQSVLNHELPNIRTAIFGESIKDEVRIVENDLMHKISTNDNLLQELENVVHSFSKPAMKLESKVRGLEISLANEKSGKQELLDMFNVEQDRNKILHERNKRLGKANNEIQKGHYREVKQKNTCDHLIVEFSPSEGLVFETAFKMIKVQVDEKHVAYRLECSKCGKIPN